MAGEQAEMRNLFLTGPCGVGKSTVIDNVLAAYPGEVYGFRTWFGPDRAEPEHHLYLSDALKYMALPAVRYENGAIAEVLLGCFNGYGHALLDGAGERGLILMDELGRLESMAEAFQAAVFRALDGPASVLGVIRFDAHGWLDEIRARPDVELLQVTEENRDDLPRQILELLME
jgi:nucleoside-triphosphatase